MALSCSGCGKNFNDASALTYTASGDLVCPTCRMQADAHAAAERPAENRRGAIITVTSIAAALVTFGVFAWIQHDRQVVYEVNGAVQSDMESSFRVLEVGLALALMAALFAGLIAYRVLRPRGVD
jgi:hypothetical protein